WHFYIGCVAGCCWSRLLRRRLVRSWFLSWRLFLLLVSRSIGRTGGLTLLTDDCDDRADVDGVVFLCLNFKQSAGYRRRNLRINLVGGNFEQRLVCFDGVADGLQPLSNSALCYGLAQLGHLNGVRHE